MNKLIFAFIFGIMLIGIVGAGEAGESIGIYKANSCITLPQICSSCTYAKISSIVSPNQTIYGNGDSYTKDGTFYNYTFCNTSELGEYKVSGHFDVLGIDEVWNYKFSVSQSGSLPSDSNSNLGVIVAIVAVMFLFGFIGFKLLDSAYPHVGYLLLALSAILAIVSLFNAWTFTQSLSSSTLSTVQFGIFNAVFIVLSVIFLLIIVFILYNLLKNFIDNKEQKKYGEGYNTKSKQYEY